MAKDKTSTTTKKEQTRKDVEKTVSDQQALVKRTLPQKKATKKLIIPGGKTMLDNISHNNLFDAIRTWLNFQPRFDLFTISFHKDPSQIKVTEIKQMDFPTNLVVSIWEHRDYGKLWLAEQLTTILSQYKLIYVKVTPDGIYIGQEADGNTFNPKSEDWQPYIEVHTIGKSEYSPY